MAVPRVNPDGSVTLRSAPSGPVVTVAGTGQLPVPSSVAAAYWVDPIAGNDNADGLTLATAVQTYRYGLSPKLDGKGVAGFCIVHQTSAVVTDDVFWPRTFAVGSAGWVYIQAESTTILMGPVVISSVTNSTSSTRGQIVCAGADFTGMENRRVRVVEGTGSVQGRIGWIQTVVSPTTINVTQAWELETEGAGNQFVAGSSIVVESLMLAPAIEVAPPPSRGQGIVFGMDSLAAQTGRDIYLNSCFLVACSVDVPRLDVEGSCTLAGSYLRSALMFQRGSANLINCSTRITSLFGQSVIWNRSSQFAVGLQVQTGVLRGSNYMQAWDWATNTAAVDLRPGAMADMAVRLHGSSAAAGTFGIKTRAGATFGYGTKPTVAGAAAYNVDCAGTQVLYAAVPVANAARLSAVCDTG
jgi:hypothetical protein